MLEEPIDELSKASGPAAVAPSPVAIADNDHSQDWTQQFHDRFVSSTVYCLRGTEVGFQAIGPEGAGLVPVFSSPELLGDVYGESQWFSTTGSDLLALLPTGYGVALDMGTSDEVRLSAEANEHVVVVRRDKEG